MIKKDNNYLYWEQLSWGIQCGLSLDLNENVYSVVNHGVIFDNNDIDLYVNYQRTGQYAG